jgi:DNA-binding beta-propeller fold protein YncE
MTDPIVPATADETPVTDPEPSAAPTADEQPSQSDAELASSAAGVKRGRFGGRRARLLLLGVLSAAALSLVVFSGWYIMFRRPMSEFPLPNISTAPMPTYNYSLYGVSRPMGIAVTPDGTRIYVTQTEPDTAVLAFDAHGNQLATLLPPETNSDHVFVYVALDPLSGDVYVSDRPAGAIYVYSGDGAFLRTFDPPTGMEGWQPLGLSFDATGHFYVTDVSDGRIHEFDPGGSLVMSIGQPDQFSFPNGVVADQNQRVYVSDSNHGRLVVLDSNGAVLAVLRRGPSAGDLGMPRGVAIDDQSRLYVVDTTDHGVKVYRPGSDATATPTFLGRFGAEGSGEGAFAFPNAVATDTRGRVYVADWDNDRVQVWTY